MGETSTSSPIHEARSHVLAGLRRRIERHPSRGRLPRESQSQDAPQAVLAGSRRRTKYDGILASTGYQRQAARVAHSGAPPSLSAGLSELPAGLGLTPYQDLRPDQLAPAVMHAVVDLGVAALIDEGRDTPEAIAEDLGANPNCIRTLMDAFCCLNVGGAAGLSSPAALKQHGRYRLAEDVKDAMDQGAGRVWALFGADPRRVPEPSLSNVVRSGEGALRPEQAAEYWRNWARLTTGTAARFGTAVAQALGGGEVEGAGYEGSAGVLGSRIGITGLKRFRVVDIGCGSGGSGFALARSGAEVTLMDLEPVLEVTRSNAGRESGVDGRLIFEPKDVDGPGDLGTDQYDVALLSEMLYMRNEEEERQLLEKVYRALKPGGKLVLGQVVLAENPADSPAAALVAIHPLYRMGFCRLATFSELKEELAAAGFELPDLQPPSGSLAIAEKQP